VAEEKRQKIRAGAIIKRLHALIDGKIDMPRSAVTAALGLLDRPLPKLAAVEHSGTIGSGNGPRNNVHYDISSEPELTDESAAIALLDRGWGKPQQSIEMDWREKPPHEMTDEELTPNFRSPTRFLRRVCFDSNSCRQRLGFRLPLDRSDRQCLACSSLR
jgi:hypothetical protein